MTSSPFDASGLQYAWNSTSLKLASECLYKYKLIMLDGWQSPTLSLHLRFGQHYAKALEDFHKARAEGVDREEALRDVVHEALIATWDYPDCETCQGRGEVDVTEKARQDMTWAGKVDWATETCGTCEGTGKAAEGAPWETGDSTKNRPNLIRSIIWYLDHFQDDPAKTIILSDGTPAVEHSIILPVDNDIVFTGHLDRLVEYAHHQYVQDQKAQPLSENVLTPAGWRCIGELSVGDEVIGVDGNPHAVTDIIPKGTVQIYEVQFIDGTATRCAWDHLWGVYDQFGKYQVLSMEEIALAPKYKKFRVPLVSPVQHPEQNFALHPLALGLLLGDGYLNGSVIQFSDQDGVEAGALAQVLPDGDDIVETSSDNYTWNIRGGNTKRILTELGLYGKLSKGKFIPSQYLFGSEKQRRMLLKGLLATDGCNIGTNYLYDSTSEQLVKDVCQLVRSLGGTASYHSRSGNAFRAHLRMPEWPNGVRSRYIKNVEKLSYTEEAACLKVSGPKQLYVTENYIVTHNTTKTTLTARYFEGYSPDHQMSMYSFLAKSALSSPVNGVMIDAAQIAVGFTRFERGFTFRSPGQLNEWYDASMHTILRARAAHLENYFPMNPTACSNYGGCPFRRACCRSPEVREQFLKADYVQGAPMNPLEQR